MEDPKDQDSTYYLRSKKRKTEDGEEPTCSYTNPNTFKRKSPIMTIPLEVLQNVFKFITYHELSDKVRKVNRRFKLAAEDLLNKSFRALSRKLQKLTEAVYEAIEASQDDMEIKCFCRLLNLLDIINFQQTVIMATIWRYVYNGFYRTQKHCMYGGLILDLYDMVLSKIAQRPYLLYGPAVVRDYALPEDIKHIIHMTKIFCIHFDKVNEEPLRQAVSASGCKIVDLLDCASCAVRNVVFETSTEDTFSAKYSYYFQNSWFVAFAILPDREMSQKQKQRMMHMRIRRIILAHTEMFMQQQQFEREVFVRPNRLVKKPSVVVYTGYGDVHDTFFCYGAMNDAAYLQKFHFQEEPNDEDIEDELPQHDGWPNIAQIEQNNEFLLVPHLGLDIDVRIDCPLAYAPYRYIQGKEDLVKDTDNLSNGIFNLYIEFHFPGAQYPRLPTTYQYHKKLSMRQF